MPSSLTATKIKDTYGQVLHVDGGVTSALKLVYDGDGTATALKVSTTAVEVPVLGISGGTANGVAYLNGSKVLTTGSALTFDGTTFKQYKASAPIFALQDDSSAVRLINVGGINYFQSGASLSNSTAELRFTSMNGGATWLQMYDTYHIWSINNSEQMRLTSTGLGIGTSSPQYKLDVRGPATTGVAAPVSIVSLPDTNGNRGGFSVWNASGGSLAGIAAQQIAGGNYPNSIGRLDVWVQNGAGTTTAATFDSSGNLGLGVTPSAWGSGWKAFQAGQSASIAGSTGNTAFDIQNNSYNNGTNYKYITTAAAALYEQLGATHTWYNGASGTAGNNVSWTQAMTLDSSGNLLVGCTATPSASVKGAGFIADSAGTDLYLSASATASDRKVWFYNPNGLVGGIEVSGSSTAYATSSDYRLKENIQPMQNALGVVAQLNPVTYTWKADGSDGQGFIAHELQAVVPDCVTGEKDAVDAEGKPVYQGIDTSFLVATLTAAIKELKAELDSTKAEVAALKGA